MIDYLIRNGLVVNGKNEPAYTASVAVRDGRIEGIGHFEPPAGLPKERIIDAQGALVTPGFVDIHRHGDLLALVNGDDELLNRQGITSVVNGNCGLSAAPAGERHRAEILPFLSSVIGELPEGVRPETLTSVSSYMEALGRVHRSVNTGILVGNGTVLASVSGYEGGEVNPEETAEASAFLTESIRSGALGISIGLAYAPEFRYTQESLIRVLAPFAGTDIPVITHIRNEGDGLFEAVTELIGVAGALNLPLHISHMKCIGRRNWGRLPRKVLQAIGEAREAGVRVSFDLYPYTTGSTQLVHLLPPEAQQGGTEKILERLSDPARRAVIRKALSGPSLDFENIVDLVGFENIYVSSLHSREFRAYAGKNLAAIAEDRGCDGFDALFDLLCAEECRVPMLDTFGSEEDVRLFYSDPQAAVISDAIYPSGGKLHPRVYGAFPKFLIDHVRERKDFSIEEAIYKMTALPAQTVGVKRGILEEGAAADLCVFRLKELRSGADFDEPARFCEGFDLVMTGGEPVVRGDVWTGGGSGRVLRR